MPVPTDPGDFAAHAPITASGQNNRFHPLYNTLNPASVGIDDSNVKANGLTAASLALPQAWQTLTVSVGAYSGTIQYYKDLLGVVHCRGTVSYTTP
jgi:hypothetical protein